jgi:hypothetical protein
MKIYIININSIASWTTYINKLSDMRFVVNAVNELKGMSNETQTPFAGEGIVTSCSTSSPPPKTPFVLNPLIF